jgi:hypothetical protein
MTKARRNVFIVWSTVDAAWQRLRPMLHVIPAIAVDTERSRWSRMRQVTFAIMAQTFGSGGPPQAKGRSCSQASSLCWYRWDSFQLPNSGAFE